MKKSEIVSKNLEKIINTCKKVKKNNPRKCPESLNNCSVTTNLEYVDREFNGILKGIFPDAYIKLQSNGKLKFVCKLGKIYATAILQLGIYQEILEDEEDGKDGSEVT